MKILFIQPPLPCNERHKRILPLGIGYLCSYLRQRLPEVELKVLDAHALNMNYSQVVSEVNCEKWDMIAFSFWTAQAPFVYNIMPSLRKKQEKALFVFGGVHTSLCPEEASEHCDICILHEGEETFFELVSRIVEGKNYKDIQGTAYREDGEFIKNPIRPLIRNLDSIPFPAWDLLPMECYTTPLHVVGGKRLPVVGSRGCPYNCTYCVSPLMWMRKVRWRSAENVIEEMKKSINELGICQFHFWDDNFLLNRKYVIELCEGILKENMKVKWTGLTRASHIQKNKDIIELLAKSGCIGLEVGIESANPETFSQIQKEESLVTIEEIAKLQKKYGMYPLFTYMAFNPGETINGYYMQSRFIDTLLSNLPWLEHFHPLPYPIYIGQFSTAYPRTQLMEDAPNLGMVLVEKWDDCFHHNINFIPNSLLNDVPIKTRNHLKPNDYLAAVNAAWAGIWTFASYSLPRFERAMEQWEYVKYLSSFFIRCDGNNTLKKIAEEVADFLNMERKKSYQYAAFSALVLAQLGLIRSALYEPELKMEIKEIKVPAGKGIKKKIKKILFLIVMNIYCFLKKR
ncbi:MAG: radical SAM protein [Candidatus Schekmanbacteria bacterium]|nr:MAG: radical SAM protein [Candidatus Schekmanbacteria bacterium]